MAQPRIILGRGKQQVLIEGLKDIEAMMMPPDVLLAAPWKRAMEQLAEEGVRGLQANAPVGRTGQLKAKIYARVQKRDFPMWVALRSRAKRKSPRYPRGYPYPNLLNYSAKHGHKGWFDRGTGPVVAKASAVLAAAGREIERMWAKGR